MQSQGDRLQYPAEILQSVEKILQSWGLTPDFALVRVWIDGSFHSSHSYHGKLLGGLRVCSVRIGGNAEVGRIRMGTRQRITCASASPACWILTEELAILPEGLALTKRSWENYLLCT